MIKSFKFFAVFVTAISLNLSVVDFAEAKRMGSGGSFGSKFSQSKSIKKNNAQQRQQAAPSKAQATNDARKKELASKGGLMGILGGLAIGGILGALFFGGAFEGLNFMDILLFALIGFLLYKLFASKRKAAGGMTPAPAGGGRFEENEQTQYRTSHTKAAGGETSGENYQASPEPEQQDGLDELRQSIPKDFDQATFIEGAKACFERLQKAWDDGDLSDLRQFTTDHVFAEIQDQHRAKTQASQTEILGLKAELLKVDELGSKTEAAVLFEAHLRENGREGTISEVWHFTKPSNSTQPTWFLDGIQQVED